MTLMQPRTWPRSCLLALTCGLVACLLAACSGGGNTLVSGGVGSGGSGTAEGAVTGFGSVIVTGVEYDDTNAKVVVDTAQGQPEATEVKLGQRVRIRHSKAGVADTIQVLPQLRGTASSAQDAQGVFTLLGQTVQIVSTSDTQNTATVLEGLTTVASGDDLEVHGNWVFNSTRGYSVLIATRIEKLSTPADPVLVSGVVHTRNNDVLTLDDGTGQTLQYAHLPANLASQSLVTAWVQRSALATSPWIATRVVDASPTLTDSEHLLLNTQVSERDLAQGEIRVQGLRVKLTSAFSSAPLNVGSTIQIEIVRDGEGYKTVALAQRQSGNDLGGLVELKGSLSWPGNSVQLSLRGNLVNVSEGVLATNCAGLKTNDKVYLEITAQRTSPGQPLRATQVSCSLQIPTNSVIEVSGTLTQFSTTAQTMTMRTIQGVVLNLVWNSTTLQPLNLADLLNRSVEIEYQTVNGENRLRKVKPN